jgi:hypothetical protein
MHRRPAWALAGLAALLSFALIAASCSALSREVIVVSETPTPPAGVAALPVTPGGPGPVNPLTGLPVDDPAALARRPLAVKISNAPDIVRPQAGIAQADLVFEHLTEGSLTRFTALFWTHTPPRAGSVRSARLIDLEIPAMYGALFAYSGASEPIRQRIAELPIAPQAYEGVTVGPPLYVRDPEIEVPHNLFTIPAAVWQRAEADGLGEPPAGLDAMRFDPVPPANGAPAERVVVDYGPDRVRWDYDPATGRYARSVDGEPHTDANTGQQVTAANVVLIYAHHQPDLSIVESEWRGSMSFSIEIQIWTLGPATLIRDGQRVDGYWMRWEEDDMLTFWADEDGTEPLALKPGNTWFQVVPLDFTGVTFD